MEELSQRFLVHHAPLPELVDTDPDLMSELAAEHGADMVVIDSLKDAAASMSDDVSGAAINAAVQALVRVADVMVLHHQRKGQDGRKPKGVDDIYGSRMISAGAGSAFVLWPKKPSEDDPLAKEQIELIHVKQAAEKIGPLVLNRDDKLGRFWMDTTVSTESLNTGTLPRHTQEDGDLVPTGTRGGYIYTPRLCSTKKAGKVRVFKT